MDFEIKPRSRIQSPTSIAAATEADYQGKPAGYFEDCRPEMLPFVPTPCQRLLDVGCGSGAFGALLKSKRSVEVWGIEPFEPAAVKARAQLDRVFRSAFPPDVELPRAAFDCVIFNDVLEHIIDPAAAIQCARTLLTATGVVVASIPNIRHFPTVWHLTMHGRWTYRDCGTLDRTHLRFFTKDSIVAIFQACGYEVVRIVGIRPFQGVPNASRRAWWIYRLANALTLGRFGDMKFERFAVVAKPARNKP